MNNVERFNTLIREAREEHEALVAALRATDELLRECVLYEAGSRMDRVLTGNRALLAKVAP